MIRFVLLSIITCLIPLSAAASPGLSGSSGLIKVSSAETLDAGNICVGAWSCYGRDNGSLKKDFLTVPVSLTLGIGTFWEVYGAYPNLLFNGDEDASGRGTLDLGTKLRFWGDRSSPGLKLAVDLLAQRHISESRRIEGVTDLSARLVVSYIKGDFGLHSYAGYLVPGTVQQFKPDSSITFGSGVEYLLMPRLKLFAEFNGATKQYRVEDDTSNSRLVVTSGTLMEASTGIQYYLSPHLTLNVSASRDFSQHNQNMTFVLGLSSCQGVGTFVKPIPQVGRRIAAKDKTREALKPLKIIPISSLMLKASSPQSSPVSKLEVDVEADREDIIIKPYGQIQISPQQASSNLTSPVIPVQASSNLTSPVIPVVIPLRTENDEVSLLPQKSSSKDGELLALDYTMNRIKGISPLYSVESKGAVSSDSPAGGMSSWEVPPQEGALPQKMKVYRKFIFTDTMYETGTNQLSGAGRKMLSEVADELRKDAKWKIIRVDGHMDNVGSLSYNMELSLKRATVAATYLISNEGIDSARVYIKGLGKSAPIADNGSAEGRRTNRRTELLLLVTRDEN
ncbi:MAG: OmpA family protein [Desulfuromonadales bacterium]